MSTKLFVTWSNIIPADDGGKKLTLGKIMSDAKNHDIIVCAFNYKNEDSVAARSFFKDKNIEYYCYEPPVRSSSLFGKVFRYLKGLANWMPAYSQRIYSTSDFNSLVGDVIQEYNPADVCLENIFLYKSLPLLSGRACEVLLHNMESLFFRSLARSEPDLMRRVAFYIESIKVHSIEKKISYLAGCGRVTPVFLTDNDYSSYLSCELFQCGNFKINCNYIYTDTVIERAPDFERPFYLFPGNMTFPPNREGMLWLLKEYEKSGLKGEIFITGECSVEDKNLLLSHQGVCVLGFVDVEKLLDLYASCIAIISPIISGGGVKVKNLEARSYGVPVVMTEFSAIGVPIDDACYVSSNTQSDFLSKMKMVFLKQELERPKQDG